MEDHSMVFWYSGTDPHKCGYCKNPAGNLSHGMTAKRLTVEDYQNLIDRGWRRSGNYCYKPVMNEICCPMYTIKCEVLKFQLSKSQKKVIKKFNKFLKDGLVAQNQEPKNEPDEETCNDNVFCYRDVPRDVFNIAEEQASTYNNSEELNEGSECSRNRSETSTSQVTSETVQENNDKDKIKSHLPKSGDGADPKRPPCKKAKVLRLEKKKEKLLQRGMSLEKLDSKSSEKSLEEFLQQDSSNKKHSFRMTLERMNMKHKYFKKTADLFAKYQMAVHNDSAADCDENQYFSFLVESPLQYVRFTKNSNVGFGSFHQLYWLDDKLIAVGVIDILPKCVSAVYFFYDPDYRNLTLGTYGSLREVEFTRSLSKQVSSIENYYMGYYIHSCQKMRYKGKLTPSYLLCPETYRWASIEKCIPKLEVSKYAKLVDDSVADENNCTGKDLDGLKLVYNRKLLLYKQFKRKYNEESLFDLIGKLVGKKCANSMIFIPDL